MTVRDFDSMLAEKAGVRPTFRVGGQDFTLRSKLPYARWNKLMAKMRSDDVDPDEATREFFRTVLVRADRDRFMALMDVEEDGTDDDAGVIDVGQLDEITDWAMEHFTGKRRNSSESSPPGANGTGPALKSVSLQPAIGS